MKRQHTDILKAHGRHAPVFRKVSVGEQLEAVRNQIAALRRREAKLLAKLNIPQTEK